MSGWLVAGDLEFTRELSSLWNVYSDVNARACSAGTTSGAPSHPGCSAENSLSLFLRVVMRVCVALAVLPEGRTVIESSECVVLSRAVRSVTMVAEARLVWHDAKVNTARVGLRASMTRDADGRDTSVLCDVAMSRCVSESYASAAGETADTVAAPDRGVGGSQTKANRARLRRASISPARWIPTQPTAYAN